MSIFGRFFRGVNSKAEGLADSIDKYSDKLEEENRTKAKPSLNEQAREALQNIRSLICPNVAVVTVADTTTLSRILAVLGDESAAARDQRIVNVLGTVLKSNPTADLATYEGSFSIKVIKVEILKPDTRPPGGIYV